MPGTASKAVAERQGVIVSALEGLSRLGPGKVARQHEIGDEPDTVQLDQEILAASLERHNRPIDKGAGKILGVQQVTQHEGAVHIQFYNALSHQPWP